MHGQQNIKKNTFQIIVPYLPTTTTEIRTVTQTIAIRTRVFSNMLVSKEQV